jgi:phage-related protein
MDTYLYGLLGLSLAANAFSFIGSLVTSSKKRDDENQRTLSAVREELINRINEVDRRVDGEVSLLHNSIQSEVNGLTSKIEELDRTLTSMIDNLEEEVYESQVYDLDNYTGTKGKTKVSRKSKKRN